MGVEDLFDCGFQKKKGGGGGGRGKGREGELKQDGWIDRRMHAKTVHSHAHSD